MVIPIVVRVHGTERIVEHKGDDDTNSSCSPWNWKSGEKMKVRVIPIVVGVHGTERVVKKWRWWWYQ